MTPSSLAAPRSWSPRGPPPRAVTPLSSPVWNRTAGRQPAPCNWPGCTSKSVSPVRPPRRETWPLRNFPPGRREACEPVGDVPPSSLSHVRDPRGEDVKVSGLPLSGPAAISVSDAPTSRLLDLGVCARPDFRCVASLCRFPRGVTTCPRTLARACGVLQNQMRSNAFCFSWVQLRQARSRAPAFARDELSWPHDDPPSPASQGKNKLAPLAFPKERTTRISATPPARQPPPPAPLSCRRLVGASRAAASPGRSEETPMAPDTPVAIDQCAA